MEKKRMPVDESDPSNNGKYGKVVSCVLRLTKGIWNQRWRAAMGDSWFSVLDTPIALAGKGIGFVGNVKGLVLTSKRYCKEEIDSACAKGRGSPVAFGTTVNGVQLMAVGWRRKKIEHEGTAKEKHPRGVR